MRCTRAFCLIAVAIVGFLSLVVIWRMTRERGLQEEPDQQDALVVERKNAFSANELSEEADVPTDRLARAMDRLGPPVPQDKGGGYELFQDQESPLLSGHEWDDLVKIPRIRAIRGTYFCSADWQHFCEFPDLENFTCIFFAITDKDLRCLAQLSKLKVLILRTPVDSSQPQEYPGREPPFSAEALEPLKDMDQLRQLTLASDRLLDDGLAQVKLVPHLLLLELTGHFTNEGLKHLAELPEIRRLWLSGHFDDDGLINLAKLETLETLALSSDRLTGRGLAHLAKLPHLRHLVLHGLRPGWTLAPLKDFVALEVLNLGRDGLTDEILATLRYSDRIKSLSFASGYHVTNRGLDCLVRLPNLEELDLLHTGITSQGFATVSECRNLRKLLLGLHRSSESAQEIQQGLAYLSRLPKLKALDLRYVLRAGAFLDVLDIPTLRKLNLDDDRFREQVKQLQERSPQLNPVATERITIRAEIIGDSSFWEYDYLENRMKVDID